MRLDKNKSRLLIEALTHSNWIENEYSIQALRQSLVAWEWLDIKGEFNMDTVLEIHRKLMTCLLENKYCGEFRDCAVSVGGRICSNIGKKAIEERVKMWIEKYKNQKINIKNGYSYGSYEMGSAHEKHIRQAFI